MLEIIMAVITILVVLVVIACVFDGHLHLPGRKKTKESAEMQEGSATAAYRPRPDCADHPDVADSKPSFHCPKLELSSEHVNTDWCHIAVDSELVNSSGGDFNTLGFSKYYGTCSTSPPATLTSPAYYEVTATVTVNKNIPGWRPILETGLAAEDDRDKGAWICGARSSCWGLAVRGCDIHGGCCTQVWNQGERVECYPDTFPLTPGTTGSLGFGLLVDGARKSLTILDIRRGVVLASLGVEIGANLWPMFGVVPDPNVYDVKMRVVSGDDVVMDDRKKALLQNVLAL